MSYYQIIAIMSGDRTKTIINKDESITLTDYVLPFKQNGFLELDWGKTKYSYQILELRIYKTNEKWDKKSKVPIDVFLKGKPNCFKYFEKKADKILSRKLHPVFVIMPIQGDKFGSQNEQRIFKEFDERFVKIEKLLHKYGCIAIRIDKQYTLDELVKRIKEEINRSRFVIADLTEERPSCYFEVGYADAKDRHTIFIASKYGIVDTQKKTEIHFDIHRNVNFFSNHVEMIEKIKKTIEANKIKLLG